MHELRLNEMNESSRAASSSETRLRVARHFRRPCIKGQRAATPRLHQGNRADLRPTRGRSLCAAQGGNGISQEGQLKLNARFYGDRYRIGGVTYGGTRATNVLVSQVGNRITFEGDVSLTGGASQSQVAGIEGQWSGSFGNYEVTTRLQVVPSGSDFSIDVDASVTRAYTDCLSCSGVHLGPSDSGWTAGHEFGHVMGLPDRYVDVSGIGSVPLPGWRGNIMGQYGGSVWQRDIDFLLGH
jgi:hypothetical protein